MSSYDSDLLFWSGRYNEGTKPKVSVIMDGKGETCILCNNKCTESCLQFSNTYDGDIVFCGECVYNLPDKISRPQSDINAHKRYLANKERERIRAEEAEKERIRQEQEFLAKFCCNELAQFMFYYEKYYGVTIDGENGKVSYIDQIHECWDPYTCEFEEKYVEAQAFKFCPYCRKEFIREKVNKK